MSVPPVRQIRDRIAREEALEEALASVRMEGLEPPASFHEAAARFVAGELSLEDLIRELRPGRSDAQVTDPAA
jgi:hypothetical protein